MSVMRPKPKFLVDVGPPENGGYEPSDYESAHRAFESLSGAPDLNMMGTQSRLNETSIACFLQQCRRQRADIFIVIAFRDRLQDLGPNAAKTPCGLNDMIAHQLVRRSQFSD